MVSKDRKHIRLFVGVTTILSKRALIYGLWCCRHTVLHHVIIKVLIFVDQHSDQEVTDQSGEKSKSLKEKASRKEKGKGRELCTLLP